MTIKKRVIRLYATVKEPYKQSEKVLKSCVVNLNKNKKKLTAYNIFGCQLICERPLRYKSVVIKDIFIHALIKIEIKITYIHKCLNKNRNQDHIYTYTASILNSSVMVLDLSYSDQFNRK